MVVEDDERDDERDDENEGNGGADFVPEDEDSDGGDATDEDDGEGDEEVAPAEEPDDVEALRATILSLAAENETLRNQLAAIGVDIDPEGVGEDEEDTDEEADEPTEDEQVAAFDADAEDRKARLATIG